MIFLFKKPKIVLDCFTHRNDVYSHHKIDYANKFYPEWWLKTPKTYDDNFWKSSTIKKCRGLIDIYQQGIMIPLWADLAFKIETGKFNWQFSDHQSLATSHSFKQWGTYADPTKYYQLKLESPWFIKCKDDIKFYWTKPFWNHDIDLPYDIMSGVVDYKYSHSANINMFISLYKNCTHTIKAGTPMAHLSPLSDKELIIKSHLVTEQEYKAMLYYRTLSFSNQYEINKRNIDKQESKCPFKFLRRNND